MFDDNHYVGRALKRAEARILSNDLQILSDVTLVHDDDSYSIVIKLKTIPSNNSLHCAHQNMNNSTELIIIGLIITGCCNYSLKLN